jgi:hypothetical protein
MDPKAALFRPFDYLRDLIWYRVLLFSHHLSLFSVLRQCRFTAAVDYSTRSQGEHSYDCDQVSMPLYSDGRLQHLNPSHRILL